MQAGRQAGGVHLGEDRERGRFRVLAAAYGAPQAVLKFRRRQRDGHVGAGQHERSPGYQRPLRHPLPFRSRRRRVELALDPFALHQGFGSLLEERLAGLALGPGRRHLREKNGAAPRVTPGFFNQPFLRRRGRVRHRPRALQRRRLPLEIPRGLDAVDGGLQRATLVRGGELGDLLTHGHLLTLHPRSDGQSVIRGEEIRVKRRERLFRLRRGRALERHGTDRGIAPVVVGGAEPDALGGHVANGFVFRADGEVDVSSAGGFDRPRRLLRGVRGGDDVPAAFEREAQAQRNRGSQRAVVEAHELETRLAPRENLGGENLVGALRRRLPRGVFEPVLDAVPEHERRVRHDVRARCRRVVGQAANDHGEFDPRVLPRFFVLGVLLRLSFISRSLGGFGLGLGKLFAAFHDTHALQQRRRVRQRQRVRAVPTVLARRAQLHQPQSGEVMQELERLERLVTKRSAHQRVVKRQRELGHGGFVPLLRLRFEVRRRLRRVRGRIALLRALALALALDLRLLRGRGPFFALFFGRRRRLPARDASLRLGREPLVQCIRRRTNRRRVLQPERHGLREWSEPLRRGFHRRRRLPLGRGALHGASRWVVEKPNQEPRLVPR